ncbi:MAG: PilN domain-containing protein [Tepidisphaeraceae bacterium]
MREVEFLPEWYPKVRKRKRMVALQAWISLMLICGLGLWTLMAQRNVHAREIELAGLGTDLNQSETELLRLEELLTLQRKLGQQDGIFLRIGRPVESTRIIATLEQLMPRDMALLDLSLDTEEAPKPAASLASRAQQQQQQLEKPESRLRLRLHGVAPTDVDLAEFLAKLTAKPFFKQVELTYSHERQQGGRVMREFEVSFLLDLATLGGR